MSANDFFTGAETGGRSAESGPMSALLAENWWAIALRGVVAILFGVIALLMPGLTIEAFVLLFAAYTLVDAVFSFIAGVRAARRHERWVALILQGLLDLIAAAIAIFMPIATILAFVWLNAAWAIVSGVLMLAAVSRLHRTHGKWILALGAILSLVWGFLLIVAPIPGVIVMTWWVGAYAILFGRPPIVLPLPLNRPPEEPSPPP